MDLLTDLSCRLGEKELERGMTVLLFRLNDQATGQGFVVRFAQAVAQRCVLIGCEQTGRRAFLMELDPLYTDVICDRFQRFTGVPAVLERTGESPIPMKAREANMR